MNLAFGQGGLKLEINVPSQHILAESMGGGFIIEGGVISSEYGKWSEVTTEERELEIATWSTQEVNPS